MKCNCGGNHDIPDNGELSPNVNVLQINVKPEFKEQASDLNPTLFSVDLSDLTNIRVLYDGTDVSGWFDIPNQAPEPEVEPTVERPGAFSHSDLRVLGALNDVEWADGGFFSRVPEEDREWLDMESINLDDDDNVIVRSTTGEVVRIRPDDARSATALFAEISDQFSWADIMVLLRVYMAITSTSEFTRYLHLATIDPNAVRKLLNTLADLRPRADADMMLQHTKLQRQ